MVSPAAALIVYGVLKSCSTVAASMLVHVGVAGEYIHTRTMSPALALNDIVYGGEPQVPSGHTSMGND